MKIENDEALYEADIELWENDVLGNSIETAVKSSVSVKDLQKSVPLQSISLRMPKDTLQDLKLIAKHYGVGYQPLMKQVIKKFVENEMMQNMRKTYLTDRAVSYR